MRWIGRGAAFGAGFFFAPQLIAGLLIILGISIALILTHLWYVLVGAVFVLLVGALSAASKQAREEPAPVQPIDPEVAKAFWDARRAQHGKPSGVHRKTTNI